MTDRQFLASEAWSTSNDLLQDPVTRKVAHGVLGVAVRSSTIRGFQNYLQSLNPLKHPNDEFLQEFWENEFGCIPNTTSTSSLKNRLLHKASLPLCSGTESLEDIQHPFTDTSQLRVVYNVYLAVYAAAHALHNLFSCPDLERSPRTKSSTCSSVKPIKPMEVSQIITLLINYAFRKQCKKF